MSERVRIENDGGVRHLILARPERRNALTAELMEELAAALASAGDDPDVTCVVLRGEGPAFSAGIDLELLPELADPKRLPAIRRRFAAAADLCEAIPKPTVAQVHGAALGAGMELAVACDLRVAAEDAVFAMPETMIGAVPDVGGCKRLAALVGLGAAKELILTGTAVRGAQARELGLVNRVAPADELDAKTAELTGELLRGAPLANGLAKRALDLAAKPASAAVDEFEITAQLACAQDPRFRDGIARARARLARGETVA